MQMDWMKIHIEFRQDLDRQGVLLLSKLTLLINVQRLIDGKEERHLVNAKGYERQLQSVKTM